MTVDEAFEKFNTISSEIREAVRSAATEQDVRLQIIDRVTTTVLGWPHNQIHCDVNNGTGFADYSLSDATKRNVVVIEAKKVGLLAIDTAGTAKIEVKLGGQVLRPIQDAITQATGISCKPRIIVCVRATDGNVWVLGRRDKTAFRPRR